MAVHLQPRHSGSRRYQLVLIGPREAALCLILPVWCLASGIEFVSSGGGGSVLISWSLFNYTFIVGGEEELFCLSF